MLIHFQGQQNKPFLYVIQIFVTYSVHIAVTHFISVSLFAYCLVVSVRFPTTFLKCLYVVIHEEYHYFLSVTFTSRQ